jgi:probable F420-dependent oxidoreductase
MAVPQRIAVSLPVPPDVTSTLSYAEWGEFEGFDDLWFADGGSIDSLTLAAAVALRTQRVRIGTAVIPVFTRTPAVLAATAATLSHLAPDRFILGLGASSHAMIEGWHGLPFDKPLTRVRETALLVRSMLAGEKTDFTGATLRSQGYRLGLEPKGHVPIYLAALRPRMLELAGELGEGVVLNLFPAEALPRMLEHVEAGARRAGATLAQREVVCRHQVIITSDKPAARDLFRTHIAPYYATPVYNRFLAWCGYEEAAATIAAGWREKNRAKTGGALSDELIDRIAIIGSVAECQERVRGLARAGVTTHVIHSALPDPYSVRAVLETFAPRSFSLP